MKTVRVYDIEWDTDGEEVDLPSIANVTVKNEDEIADKLSDEYGWCVFSFRLWKGVELLPADAEKLKRFLRENDIEPHSSGCYNLELVECKISKEEERKINDFLERM